MKLKRTQLLIAGLVLVALALLGGYLLLSGGRQYSTDMSGLRTQFNEDKGKVRVLMVLSPT
jgi:hypothetical protein